MATIAEVRSKFPQYADMSDLQLANALHRKFYKDIPLDKFYPAVGITFDKEYDASKGGGEFRPFGISTGIKTPEWLDRGLSGTGRGMKNIARNAANVVGAVSDDAVRDASALDADLLNTRAGAIGNFIGEAAAVTPLTLGVGAGLGAVGKAGGTLARIAGNPITRGMAEGAVQGGLSAGPDNRMGGAAIGAAVGGLLPAAGMGVSKFARGMTRTPEAQLLLDRGVSLTPGQMNPTGAVNQIEESIQSVPMIGSAIRSARENAQEQFQRAAIQEGSMAPLSGGAGPIGSQLDDAYRSFGPAYEPGKGFPVGAKIVNSAGPDVGLDDAFAKLAKKPRAGLVPAERINESRVLRDQLNEVVQAARRKGGLGSEDLLTFRSGLREAQRRFSGPGVKEQAMRELYGDAEAMVTKALDSQLPAEAMAAVGRADAKYGTYKTLEAAVAKARDRPQGFTGTMLSQAVKESTPQPIYARGGGGPLRDLAAAASNTFEVRAPSTGARLGVIGSGVLAPTVGVPVAGGLLGLAGTETGRRIAAGQTGVQQKLLGLLAKPQSSLTAAERDLLARYARGLLVSPATSE